MYQLYFYDDGGRKEAGKKGMSNDCAVRALSIYAEIDYQEAYRKCREYGFKAATGMPKKGFVKLMNDMGYVWKPLQAKKGEPRTKLHDLSQDCIVSVSRHYVAIKNGHVRDNHDPRRLPEGRCAYGIWVKH